MGPHCAAESASFRVARARNCGSHCSPIRQASGGALTVSSPPHPAAIPVLRVLDPPVYLLPHMTVENFLPNDEPSRCFNLRLTMTPSAHLRLSS